MPPLNAVIYVRVSSDRQATEEKVSVPSQLEDCRRLATERGYTIIAEFIDSERYRAGGKLVQPSGTRADRPALLALLTRVKAGDIHAIIAWREDRLYRSLKAASLIDDLIETTGVKVELVKEQFDRSMLGFRAAIARYELQAIKDRMDMGRNARLAEGLPLSKVPLVYQREHDPATGQFIRYIFNEQHRPYFDEMARLFLDHTPYNQIAQVLRRHPVTGARLQPSDIHRIIRDPFYRGKIAIHHKRRLERVIDGKHPPAWDPATCIAIEQEIARRARVGYGAARGPDAIFTGVLRCGFCGNTMGSFITKKNKPNAKAVRAYRCRQPDLVKYGHVEGPAHCPNNIREKKLVGLFCALLEHADIDGFLDTLTQLSAPADNRWLSDELTRLRTEASDIEQDLKTVKRKASQQALQTELASVTAQINLIQSQLQSQRPKHSIDVEALRARMATLRDPALWTKPPATIRQALTNVIPAIYAAHGQISLTRSV